jgi:hypothetical protein
MLIEEVLQKVCGSCEFPHRGSSTHLMVVVGADVVDVAVSVAVAPVVVVVHAPSSNSSSCVIAPNLHVP